MSNKDISIDLPSNWLAEIQKSISRADLVKPLEHIIHDRAANISVFPPDVDTVSYTHLTLPTTPYV